MRKLYARWYRYKSGRDKGAKTHEVMDVNADTVESVMREYGVNVLIHGHTHRPATHALIINGLSAQRVVLPEWDGKEWLLCWTTQGLKKEPL
jgi:UDP-2,3-diacylglucosamine hydrolase